MKLRRLVIITLILGVLAPLEASAQGFKWWQEESLKAELGLTPDQVTKLEAVFQDLLPRMTTEKDELERLEKQLSEVIRYSNVGEAEVMRQVQVVEAARSALGKTRTLMIYRLYRRLTPEQRLRMKALHEKWEEERRRNPKRH
jgi:Spy/CpxP family protein refolding chaperone